MGDAELETNGHTVYPAILANLRHDPLLVFFELASPRGSSSTSEDLQRLSRISISFLNMYILPRLAPGVSETMIPSFSNLSISENRV